MPVHYATNKATRAVLRVGVMSLLRAALPGHEARKAAREAATEAAREDDEEKAKVAAEIARKEAVVLSYVSQEHSALGGEDETLVVRVALESAGLNKDCTDAVR